MSDWITDRLPTAEDALDDGRVWVTLGTAVLFNFYHYVKLGTPWMPVPRPAPYVKPEKHVVKEFTVERFCVINRELRDIVAKYIPTRKQAERIRDIYDEVDLGPAAKAVIAMAPLSTRWNHE